MTKSKKPNKAELKKKCDKLLTPIIKKMYPICLLNGAKGNEKCTYDTQVAHHHVHKSKASSLRYDLDNLIPLCNHCHLMLHHNESFWASKIVLIRGIRWFEGIERDKYIPIKTNKAYYEEELERLTEILEQN